MGSVSKLHWPGMQALDTFVIDLATNTCYGSDRPLPPTLLDLDRADNRYVRLDAVMNLVAKPMREETRWILSLLQLKFEVQKTVILAEDRTAKSTDSEVSSKSTDKAAKSTDGEMASMSTDKVAKSTNDEVVSKLADIAAKSTNSDVAGKPTDKAAKSIDGEVLQTETCDSVTYLPVSTLLAFVMVWPCCRGFQSAKQAMLDHFDRYSETVCMDCGYIRRDCRCSRGGGSAVLPTAPACYVGSGVSLVDRATQVDMAPTKGASMSPEGAGSAGPTSAQMPKGIVMQPGAMRVGVQTSSAGGQSPITAFYQSPSQSPIMMPFSVADGSNSSYSILRMPAGSQAGVPTLMMPPMTLPNIRPRGRPPTQPYQPVSYQLPAQGFTIQPAPQQPEAYIFRLNQPATPTAPVCVYPTWQAGTATLEGNGKSVGAPSVPVGFNYFRPTASPRAAAATNAENVAGLATASPPPVAVIYKITGSGAVVNKTDATRKRRFYADAEGSTGAVALNAKKFKQRDATEESRDEDVPSNDGGKIDVAGGAKHRAPLIFKPLTGGGGKEKKDELDMAKEAQESREDKEDVIAMKKALKLWKQLDDDSDEEQQPASKPSLPANIDSKAAARSQPAVADASDGKQDVKSAMVSRTTSLDNGHVGGSKSILIDIYAEPETVALAQTRPGDASCMSVPATKAEEGIKGPEAMDVEESDDDANASLVIDINSPNDTQDASSQETSNSEQPSKTEVGKSVDETANNDAARKATDERDLIPSTLLSCDDKEVSEVMRKVDDDARNDEVKNDEARMDEAKGDEAKGDEEAVKMKKLYGKFEYLPTGEHIFRCLVTKCSQCFDVRAAAEVHSRTHDQADDTVAHLHCTECAELIVPFYHWYDLLRHMRAKHDVRLSRLANSCKYCGLTFESEERLVTHIEFHYSNRYKCIHCGLLLLTWTQVKRHLESCPEKHKTGINLGCPYCTFVFHKKTIRNLHLLSHSDAGLTCALCEDGGTWADWKTLRKHYQQKHAKVMQAKIGPFRAGLPSKRRPPRCSVCGADFRTHDQFGAHMTRTHDYVPYVLVECATCARQFKSERSHEWHARHAHGEEVPCDKCDFVATSKTNLKLHTAEAHVQKQHACSECDKSFSLYQQLRVHMAHHARHTIHSCTHCDREFTRASDLRQHVAGEHGGGGGGKQYCPECDFSCHTRLTLKVHVAKYHPELLEGSHPVPDDDYSPPPVAPRRHGNPPVDLDRDDEETETDDEVDHDYIPQGGGYAAAGGGKGGLRRHSGPGRPRLSDSERRARKGEWRGGSRDYSDAEDRRERRRLKRLQKELEDRLRRLKKVSCARTRTYAEHQAMKRHGRRGSATGAMTAGGMTDLENNVTLAEGGGRRWEDVEDSDGAERIDAVALGRQPLLDHAYAAVAADTLRVKDPAAAPPADKQRLSAFAAGGLRTAGRRGDSLVNTPDVSAFQECETVLLGLRGGGGGLPAHSGASTAGGGVTALPSQQRFSSVFESMLDLGSSPSQVPSRYPAARLGRPPLRQRPAQPLLPGKGPYVRQGGPRLRGVGSRPLGDRRDEYDSAALDGLNDLDIEMADASELLKTSGAGYNIIQDILGAGHGLQGGGGGGGSTAGGRGLLTPNSDYSGMLDSNVFRSPGSSQRSYSGLSGGRGVGLLRASPSGGSGGGQGGRAAAVDNSFTDSLPLESSQEGLLATDLDDIELCDADYSLWEGVSPGLGAASLGQRGPGRAAGSPGRSEARPGVGGRAGEGVDGVREGRLAPRETAFLPGGSPARNHLGEGAVRSTQGVGLSYMERSLGGEAGRGMASLGVLSAHERQAQSADDWMQRSVGEVVRPIGNGTGAVVETSPKSSGKWSPPIIVRSTMAPAGSSYRHVPVLLGSLQPVAGSVTAQPSSSAVRREGAFPAPVRSPAVWNHSICADSAVAGTASHAAAVTLNSLGASNDVTDEERSLSTDVAVAALLTMSASVSPMSSSATRSSDSSKDDSSLSRQPGGAPVTSSVVVDRPPFVAAAADLKSSDSENIAIAMGNGPSSRSEATRHRGATENGALSDDVTAAGAAMSDVTAAGTVADTKTLTSVSDDSCFARFAR